VSIASAQTTGTWNTDTVTPVPSWGTASNWAGLTGGLVPNAIGASAGLTFDITGDRAIALDADTTLGALTLTDNANRYTLNMVSARTLTFDVSSGNAALLVTGAGVLDHRIGNTQGQGIVQLNDNLAITVGAGSNNAATTNGQVRINAKISGPGALILGTLDSNDGTGTAVSGSRGTYVNSNVANDYAGGTVIDSGYLQVGGNIGNLGSGNLTINASDGTRGGTGSSLRLQTGGGTLPNNIVFGNAASTAGANPRLAILIQDSTSQNYVFTGKISGDISGQFLRLWNNTANAAVNSTIRLQGNSQTSGDVLSSNSTTVIQVRAGSLILDNANALGASNTIGTSSSGGLILGNISNGSAGTAQILTNGYDVGSRIRADQVATAAGNTNNDNIVIGGVHTAGTATYNGPINITRIVGGTRKLQFTAESGGTVVINSNIVDGAVTGNQTIALPVEKIGGGKVELNLSHTYSGGTTVSAGTLVVKANGNGVTTSGTGTGPVVVNSGGTLTGGGTILGNLTANTGGNLLFNVGGTPASFDRLDVKSSLALAADSAVTITDAGSAALGTYRLINATLGTGSGDLPALTLPLGWAATLVRSGGGTNLDLVVTSLGVVAPPAAPSAPSLSVVSTSQVDVSWSAVAGATSYTVKRSTVSGGPYTVAQAGLATTSYSDTTLAAGTTYYYVISATNGGGEGANSTEATTTTVPPAGSTPSLSVVSSSQIDLAWSSVTGATGYTVKRSTVNGGPYSVVQAGLASTAFSDTALSAGTAYYYVVSAINAGGEGLGSDQASATTWTALEAWRVAKGLALAGTGSSANSADPDGDGVSNVLEYVLDTLPTVSNSSSPTPVSTSVDGKVQITFLRARPATEVTYRVFASSDLVSWTQLGGDNPGTVGQNVTVTDTPPGGATRRFLRLEATVN
jgi:autotransporter-associated beta strand protein